MLHTSTCYVHMHVYMHNEDKNHEGTYQGWGIKRGIAPPPPAEIENLMCHMKHIFKSYYL